MPLREQIEALAARPNGNEFSREDRAVFEEFKRALNRGEVRAAEKSASGKWVGQLVGEAGMLLGFRMGAIDRHVRRETASSFSTKIRIPSRPTKIEDNVRIVPGGSTIRDGAYIAPGVVCMPPMFVNAGAYVDAGTMIDSHALVGSCAQIGKRVHISAAAQIGGVLEPVGAVPVIIEDDVLVGGNCGVYEGAIVRERAVLASGTILTGSTPVYDLVRGEIYQRTAGGRSRFLRARWLFPARARCTTERGREWGLSLYAAIIVKYRDEKTDTAVQLEDYLCVE